MGEFLDGGAACFYVKTVFIQLDLLYRWLLPAARPEGSRSEGTPSDFVASRDERNIIGPQAPQQEIQAGRALRPHFYIARQKASLWVWMKSVSLGST